MRISTGGVTILTDRSCLRDAVAGYVMDIYSGVEPTLPDTAASGQLLVTLTSNSGTFTAETASAGSMTLTGGGSGSVNTVTVNAVDILGAAVPYNTSLTQTAADVATQINRNPKNLLYFASSVGAVITITALNGLGVLPNTWVVTSTLTTITASYVNMTGGVDSANGLHFDMSVGGIISKLASETWSGTATTTGTAGWFRIRGAGDSGVGASTTAMRIDGTIGSSGADMNLGNLTVTAGAPFSVPSGSLTLPQQ